MSLESLKAAFPFPAERPDVVTVEHGWFGPQHVEALSACIEPSAQIVLEVGSWLGLSTRWISRRAPQASVIAIDHWKGSVEHQNSAECKKLLPSLYDTFIRNSWNFRHQIIPVRLDSPEGLRKVHAHGVVPEVIYLDGSHAYADVKKDLDAILTLFPSAILIGDDLLWTGVARAVTEAVVAGRLKVGRKGNVWWKEHPSFGKIPGQAPFP